METVYYIVTKCLIVKKVLALKLKPWLVPTVLKKFKIVITNHDFNIKHKGIVTNYGFNIFNFLKKFRTVVINYGFDDVVRRN